MILFNNANAKKNDIPADTAHAFALFSASRYFTPQYINPNGGQIADNKQNPMLTESDTEFSNLSLG